MTSSECTSFLDEGEKKRSEGKRIRDQGMLALVPCLRCSRASEKCWVGADSKKCAYCTENTTLCTVNSDRCRPADNAKAIVDGTPPRRRVSPEQESQKALREEAERLYAMNPSWHIKEAETKLSNIQSSARKLDSRKRAGKRIRDERRLALVPCLRCSRASEYCWVGIKAKNCAYCTEQGRKCTLRTKNHTVVDENHSVAPKKRMPRLCLKSASRPVDELQETRRVTPRKVKQEPPWRDQIEGEPEATSDIEYQSDGFNSGSESPCRIASERQSVEASEGGQKEPSPESSEDIAALRREVIEMRREMREMRQEFRNGLQEMIFHVREQKPAKIEIEIINLEDD